MADREPNWDALNKRNAEDTRVANEEAFFAAGRKRRAEADAAQQEAERNTPEAIAKREKAKADQKEADYRSQQQRAAYVKSQRDYFESVSEGMSAASIVERGGAQLASTTSIESGAAGITAAGGERKGSVQTIEGGADGITAAGGRKTGPHLGIGASFKEQYQAVRWGSGMQAYRTLGRAYQRAQREKKKNDGGLTAARQPYSSKEYFPTRPIFTIGGVSYGTMTFEGVTPITGVYSACEIGWPKNTIGEGDPFQRHIMQAGRLSRKTSFAS